MLDCSSVNSTVVILVNIGIRIIMISFSEQFFIPFDVANNAKKKKGTIGSYLVLFRFMFVILNSNVFMGKPAICYIPF